MATQSKIQLVDRFKANSFLLAEQILGSKRFDRALGGVKRRFLNRLTDRLAVTTLHHTPSEVDIRTGLSPEEFRREYFLRSRPVIFRGAARAWPCCQKWNLDFFSVAYGQSDLLLVDAKGLTTREDSSRYQFLSLRELVGDIRGGGDKYLRFSPLLHDNPQLASDLDLDWLGRMRGGRTFGNTYYMFIGGKGRKTYLHADQPCNLYVQVTGEKKWTLYAPEDSVCLYPEVTNTAYVKSPVNLDAPDPRRFPLFQHARAMTAHLQPGDVLYVPPHVWHQVENLSDSIAVGYRFSSLRAALNSSVTFSLIRILSTNPPVWKTREYGQKDTNLIWAHTSGKIDEVLSTREARRADRPQEHEELAR